MKTRNIFKRILSLFLCGIINISVIIPFIYLPVKAEETTVELYSDTYSFEHTCTSPTGGYDVLEPHVHDASCLHYHEHAYKGTLQTYQASWENGSTYAGQKCATQSGGCYTKAVRYYHNRYVSGYYGWWRDNMNETDQGCAQCGRPYGHPSDHPKYSEENRYVYVLTCTQPESYLKCTIPEGTLTTLHYEENFCYKPVYHQHTHLGNEVTVNGITGYDTSGECYQDNRKHLHDGIGQPVVVSNLGTNGEDLIGYNMSGNCYTEEHIHIHTNDGIDGNDDTDNDCYEDIMGWKDKYTYKPIGSQTTGNACTYIGTVTCSECGQTNAHVFTVDTSKVVNRNAKTITSGIIACQEPDLSAYYNPGDKFDLNGSIFALYDNEADDFVYNSSPYGTNKYFGCCLYGKLSSDPNREQYWGKVGNKLICPIKTYQYDANATDYRGADITPEGTSTNPIQIYTLTCNQSTDDVFCLSCPKTPGVDIDSYEYCCQIGDHAHLVDSKFFVNGENVGGNITTVSSLNVKGENINDHCVFKVFVIKPDTTTVNLGTFDKNNPLATFTDIDKNGDYYVTVKCYSYQDDITKLKYENVHQYKYTVKPFANYVRYFKESITKKDGTTTYPLNQLFKNKVAYADSFNSSEVIDVNDFAKTGYTLNGFKDKDDSTTYLYDANGAVQYNFLDASHSKVWNIYANYTPNDYNVSYTLENPLKDTPVTKSFTATYDEVTSIPDDANVYNGYTFDGWYKQNETSPLFNKNKLYTGASGIWKETADTFVEAKYHPNTYKIKYNNTDISDTNLTNMDIVYDASYSDIAVSPYKEGYIFDGHYFLDNDGNEQKLWDNIGKATRTIYDYVSNPTDNSTVNVYKRYIPKDFDIEIGDDYDEDGVLDNVDITETATYDATWFDLPIPTVRYGLTFDGYYILGTDTCIAKYDADTNTLTKVSNTWIWDDGNDWNNDPNHNTLIQVESRWTHNDIKVIISTETSEKIDKTVGKSSGYHTSTTERIEKYDRVYKPITVPSKRGYTFDKYIVKPINTGEEEVIWESSGKAKLSKFLWTGNSDKINTAVETAKVYVYSVFKQNTIKGNIPTSVYENRNTLPANIEINEVYDNAYHELSFIPSQMGYIFDGIQDKDGNLIWDKDGKPVQEVWQYIESDIEDFEIIWKPKEYILTWNNGTETKKIKFGEKVPDLTTMDTPSDPTLNLDKNGYSFSGYSFDFYGKEIYVFDKNAKFTGNVWNYDVGDDGTEIPLKDLFDANTYTVTIKDNGEIIKTVDVIYGMGYNSIGSMEKTGYIFDGYEVEADGMRFWDINGNPCFDVYSYTCDITVVTKFVPKTYILHCDDKEIKVTFGELIEAYAPKKHKDAEEDSKVTRSFVFQGWYLEGEQIFDKDGVSVVGVWNKDLGADGTHIYLTDKFETIETEKTLGGLSDFRDKIINVLKRPEVQTAIVVTSVVTIPPVLIAFLIGLFIILLWAIGEVSFIYVYDDTAEKKKLKGLVSVKHYKKNEYQEDGIRYYVKINKKYYEKFLDVDSKLVSIRFAPSWVQRQNAKRIVLKNEKDIRVSCKEKYGDFSMASIRTEKGDRDRGFVELKLDKTFNN